MVVALITQRRDHVQKGAVGETCTYTPSHQYDCCGHLSSRSTTDELQNSQLNHRRAE